MDNLFTFVWSWRWIFTDNRSELAYFLYVFSYPVLLHISMKVWLLNLHLLLQQLLLLLLLTNHTFLKYVLETSTQYFLLNSTLSCSLIICFTLIDHAFDKIRGKLRLLRGLLWLCIVIIMKILLSKIYLLILQLLVLNKILNICDHRRRVIIFKDLIWRRRGTLPNFICTYNFNLVILILLHTMMMVSSLSSLWD